jgi:hypothetical protein
MVAGYSELLLAAGLDEVEEIGLNGERPGVIGKRAGFESFALIPNFAAVD